MCGIVGYIGKNNAKDIIIDGQSYHEHLYKSDVFLLLFPLGSLLLIQ